MPVQVSYPGVYVQEVSSGVQTITGVATSIAAFFGRASKGPLNKAVRILSLADFTRTFGEPHPNSDLSHSVRQFYANGGSDCYVVRLANGAARSELTLNSLDGSIVLVATAKAEGSWGNGVRLEVDYNTSNPDAIFNLRVFHEEGGVLIASESHTGLTMNPTSPRFAPKFVSQSSNLIDLKLHAGMGDENDAASFYNTLANSFAGYSQARRPLGADGDAVGATLDALIGPTRNSFQISVNGGSPATVVLEPWVENITDLNTLETTLTGLINQGLADVNPAWNIACTFEAGAGQRFLTITADGPNNVVTSVQVNRSNTNDIAAALMLGVDQGGVEQVRWSNFRPAPNAAILLEGTNLSNLNEMGATLQNAITSITIDGQAIPLNLVTSAPGDPWFTSNNGNDVHGNNDGLREKLRLIAGAINGTAGLTWSAQVWGSHLAILATQGPPGRTPGISTTAVTLSDNMAVNQKRYALGESALGAFAPAGVNGSDGNAPQENDYLGDQAAQTGFHALDSVDLFNLMVIPGDNEVNLANIWGPASIYCQNNRAFLLIDPPETWTSKDRPAVVNDTSMIGDLRAQVVNTHSAVFYPRLKFSDNGLKRSIGPGGAIAGLIARTDVSRGVWKAPAGQEADVRNILGLDVKLTDLENGVLNKLGVNCIREFPGAFVNWGARTMDGYDDKGSEWKYIPIRRLALFIEESLHRGTQWVVFEPNDEPLWARIRMNVGAFMTGLFRQGAFQGATPKDAFFVKCDSETTTQADRNLGMVNIQVGFAPLKPAEFVVITIQQMAGDL